VRSLTFVYLLQVKSTKAIIYVVAKSYKWYQASMDLLALRIATLGRFKPPAFDWPKRK
jgi:hypothetical protein